MVIEEIDLSKLKENYLYIKELTKKQVIPVIKSNAYGLGVLEVSNALVEVGVKLVAVNDISEALTIRENNYLFDILVMNSISLNDYTYLYKYPNIILTINCLNDIKNLNEYCYLNEIRVHLQVDTGMNRLGVSSLNEYQQIIDLINHNSKFSYQGIYTHFTSRSNYANQLQKFTQYVDYFAPPLIHAAASSTYDLCDYGNAIRIGLDLYGDGSKEHIKQVVAVKAVPIAIRTLNALETLGYNETFKALTKQRVAIIDIGYNEGYKRDLKGFYSICNNKKYQVIGNICMNHFFILIDDSITETSVFELISENIPIITIADYLKTIPGDILCGLNIKTKKYKR